MRWWLALAFAGVAGLTALAVVAVLSNRSENAFRTYAQEFAVGNTVAATEPSNERGSIEELRRETTAIAERRRLAIFVFDTTPGGSRRCARRPSTGRGCRAAARRCARR